jgi:hypothetical protein
MAGSTFGALGAEAEAALVQAAEELRGELTLRSTCEDTRWTGTSRLAAVRFWLNLKIAIQSKDVLGQDT